MRYYSPPEKKIEYLKQKSWWMRYMPDLSARQSLMVTLSTAVVVQIVAAGVIMNGYFYYKYGTKDPVIIISLCYLLTCSKD